MKRTLSRLLVLGFTLLPLPAWAERDRLIEGSRIYLGELVTGVTANGKSIDLGSAPQAGSSRRFSAEELNRLLKSAGERVTVDDGVRVVRASKRWTQPELLAWISPAVRQALPTYATVLRIDAPRSLLLPSATMIGHVELPQLPKRRGAVTTTVVIDVTVDGEVERRLSLPVVLDLAEPPKPLVVPRSTAITLTVRLGLAQVSAPAVTLQAAEVGSVALCRVVKTRKVLRARILSETTAEVTGE